MKASAENSAHSESTSTPADPLEAGQSAALGKGDDLPAESGMRISRRGFLGTLAAVGALAAVPAPVKAALESGNLDAPLEFNANDCHAIAAYLCKEIAAQNPRTFGKAYEAKYWVGVDLWFPPAESKISAERYLKPAAYALSEEIKFRKMTRFGELELPKAVESCARVTTPDNVSVRVIRAYDIHHGEMVFRADVIGS